MVRAVYVECPPSARTWVRAASGFLLRQIDHFSWGRDIMAKSPGRVRVETFTGAHFRAHALLIGQSSLAWNALHEHLALIFWESIDHRTFAPIEVWQSSALDRAKRKMLEAILPYLMDRWRERPNLYDEMKWLLVEAEKLEDTRNTVIHAPLSFTANEGAAFLLPENIRVVPHDYFGNPRARKLSNKDLLSEYRWCRDTANALSLYCKSIRIALVFPQSAWPERPKLPIRKSRAAKQRRRGTPK
jgi:hypothetical protein